MRSETGRINFTISLLTTTSLIICLLSGIPLTFHYQPLNPLNSVLTIEAFVSLGSFFRNLHYFSAQLTLLFLTLHLIDSIHKRLFLLKKPISWTALVLLYPLLLYVTFTGYLLRADEMGEFAGNIAENMLLEVPGVGPYLQVLLVAKTQTGFHRVYTWHIILSLLTTTGLFVWHVRPRAVLRWEHLFHFLWIFPIVIFWRFPLIPFEDEKARGPWFFVGAQQLLKFIDPSLVFFLLILPLLILSLYAYLPKFDKIFTLILSLYFFIYIAFSVWFFFN